MNFTLNLISPKTKRELIIKQFYQIIKTFLIIVFLFSVLIAMLLLCAEFILQTNLIKTINERIFVLKNNHQNPNQKIKIINQGFGEINNIQKKFISWSKILIYFNQVIPQDIKIYSFKNINDSIEIQIIAIAKTREALLKFQENLKNYPAFSQVEFPFLNLISKKDINFQLKVKLDMEKIEEQLKQKNTRT
jgi:Tfp pilus assembly protein PilN